MSSRLKRLLAVFAPVHAILSGFTRRDLARRPKEMVRGPKTFWRIAVWFNPLTSIAYWVVGRRRPVSGRARLDDPAELSEPPG